MRNITDTLSIIEERCRELKMIHESDWSADVKRVMFEGRIELLKRQLSELEDAVEEI